MNKPNCYECMYRREVPGSCHSFCMNRDAQVVGHEHGKKNGWFYWPSNFDPTWLTTCDGFKRKGVET